ncbi:MAG: AGE family epimerase/isomerase [Pseudomonadota bacterium]
MAIPQPADERCQRIAHWLEHQALPLWHTVGLCPDTGGFHETLTMTGDPVPDALRRVRVQFRQMYAFAHAHALGLTTRGLEAARQGFEFVWEHAWAPDGQPGWAHTLYPDGSLADGKRDTYDHAFAVFGLAWYFSVSRDTRALFAIGETLRYLEERLRAGNGGWIEDDSALPKAVQRRQNPHMHAFEASMALFELTGDASAIETVSEQLSLFKAHFYNPAQRVVLEFFDQDWSPIATPNLQRVEPGHLVEWVWLLREYERLFGLDLEEVVDPHANALFNRAHEIGLAPGGIFIVDELHMDGSAAKQTRRFWPQTELLKAYLSQYRASGDIRYRRQAEALIDALFDSYLSDCAPGGWRDVFTLDGEAATDVMPASTFYHIFNAFAQALTVLAPADAPRPQTIGPRQNAYPLTA